MKATALPPFQLIFDEHAQAVLAFLTGAVGTSEAEDCFQETMLSALRAYPRLGDASNLRGWLFTIARRKAIDAHRARARRPAPVADPDPGATFDVHPETDDGLWDQVRGLPVQAAPRSGAALRRRQELPRDRGGDVDHPGFGAPERARGAEKAQKGTPMTVDQAVTKRFLERAEAKGLIDVAVTTMDSPIGTLLLMSTPKGLVRIAFESENRDDVFGEVARAPVAAHPRGAAPS